MSSEATGGSLAREQALEDLLCINHAYLHRLEEHCAAAFATGEAPRGVDAIGDLLSKLRRPQQERILDFYCFQGLISLAAALVEARFRVEPTSFLLERLATLLFHLGLGRTALRLALGSRILEGSPGSRDRFLRIAIEANEIDIARQVQEGFPTTNTALLEYLKESEVFLAAAPKRECSVLVVSLERDIYRRAACRRMLDALGVPYRIVDAIGRSNVPPEFVRLLRPDRENDFSGFGALSHFLCWQTIIDDSLDVALVIEDDAILRGWPGVAANLAALGGFDILFVNDRLAPSRQCCASIDALGAVPLLEALSEIAAREPKFNAPGSDGYLVSNAAARKLVDLVNAAGFPASNPDWCLLMWSLGREEAEAIPESTLRKVLSQEREQDVAVRSLNAGTTTRPLALHRPVGVWRDTRVD